MTEQDKPLDLDLQERTARIIGSGASDMAIIDLSGRILALVAEVRRLREALEEFAEQDCEYGDGCPTFGTRHGRCVPCKARAALSPQDRTDE